MIEIGSGSVSMRKLQSTTFGLRPKACGGLKKIGVSVRRGIDKGYRSLARRQSESNRLRGGTSRVVSLTRRANRPTATDNKQPPGTNGVVHGDLREFSPKSLFGCRGRKFGQLRMPPRHCELRGNALFHTNSLVSTCLPKFRDVLSPTRAALGKMSLQ